MRCGVVRKILEEEIEMPPAVQAHMAHCTACRDYLRQWQLIRTGFVALQQEEAPEASTGFATRLLRRLERASGEFQPAQQFIVRAGRRVVYGTLLVALALLLALALPSSGPVRNTGVLDSVLDQPQVVATSWDQSSNEQIIGVDISDVSNESGPSSQWGGGTK